MIRIFSKDRKELHSDVDVWVVEWTRRYGEFSSDTERCFQGFTNEKEAYEFADSIKEAHKLIGNTSGTRVSVKKHKSGL